MPADARVHVVSTKVGATRCAVAALQREGIDAASYGKIDTLFKALRVTGDGVIVVNCDSAKLDVLSLLQSLRQTAPAARSIIIVQRGDASIAKKAIELGAFGFIERPFSPETLIAFVRSALIRTSQESEPSFSVNEFMRQVGRLTPRERQVFGYLMDGKTNKKIARDLGISPRTVEVYRTSIRAKTKCDTIPVLVQKAARAGMI